MGKQREFIQIIKANEGLIYKVTTLYTQNSHDQKDLYQEIVYQLWRSFDSFRNEAKRSTWMYKVALNTAISQLKKNKRKPGFTGTDQVLSFENDNPDPLFEERLKKMYTCIHRLNLLDRGLMLLLLEGRKYEEIAEISGLTLTNVATRISRIKAKLKSEVTKL